MSSPETTLSDLPIGVRLAKAVILFLRGGPWLKADHDTWFALTGERICTTKTLANLARKVEGQDAAD